MFETARLRLREFRASDMEFFVGLFNTYDVLLNITVTYATPMTRERVVALLEEACKSPLFVIAEAKDGGVPVGFTSLYIGPAQNMDGELGIALGREWWGQGFGTEILEWVIAYSFKSIGLRRLSLSVFASNPGAISLYEHVGFKHEGRKRGALWKGGKWVDVVRMGLLSREYYADTAQDSIDTVDPMQKVQGTVGIPAVDWVVL